MGKNAVVSQINWPFVGVALVFTGVGMVAARWVEGFSQSAVTIIQMTLILLGICILQSPFDGTEFKSRRSGKKARQ